jgi:PAS domain S-box-containing protein
LRQEKAQPLREGADFMATPIFTIDPVGNVSPFNSNALRLMPERNVVSMVLSALAQELRDQQVRGLDVAEPRWLRLPKGQRLWTLPLCLPLTEADGSMLLALPSAGSDSLDATAFRGFERLVDDLAQGGTLDAALDALCRTLHDRLELAAVRVLEAGDSDLREVACAGDPTALPAVRMLGESLETLRPGTATLAVRAARKGAAVTQIFDEADIDPEVINLRRHGVRAAAAWPLRGFEQPLVLEVFAWGDDDLNETTTADFFNRWVGWLARRLCEALTINEQRLVTGALQGAATPAFVTDDNGTFVWINDAFSEIYGYSREAVLGQTPRLLQSGRHGPRYYRELWSTLCSGQAWSGETVDRTIDGELLSVRQNITPVRHGGHITHYLALHFDVNADVGRQDAVDGLDRHTGLMTRAAFIDECERRLAAVVMREAAPALLLVNIETALGTVPRLGGEHEAALLTLIGKRLRECLLPGTLCGNLGNYSFALMPANVAEMASLRSRIEAAVHEPLPMAMAIMSLRCRMAVAQWPQNGDSASALLYAADRQLTAGGELKPVSSAVAMGRDFQHAIL